MKNLLFLFLTITSLALNAQSTTDIFAAYAAADADAFEQFITQAKKNNASALELAKLQYASFGAYQKAKNEKGAQRIVDAAEANLKSYLKNNPKSAEANALLSGVYGLQIGLSPMKGMTLGSKSSKLIDKALQLDNTSGLTHYLKGSSLYYTPRLWGGDVPKAIEHLNTAKTIFETANQTKSWEYLAVLGVLGQAYHYQEELPKAKAAYDAALTIAPDYGWVKYQLLPTLEKDMK